MTRNNKGFSIVEVMIIVLVITIAGFIGWKVWEATNAPKAAAPIAPAGQSEVQTKEDLDTVDKELDSADIEGNELQQLESEVNF